MKSERRHELQDNVLAHWLSEKLPKLREYSTAIIGGVVIVAAGLLIYVLLTTTWDFQSSAGWNEYHIALNDGNADELIQIAEAHPDTTVGLWARQSAADQWQALGIEQLYIDRELASGTLTKAADSYLIVINQLEKSTSPQNRMLLQRATFGFAQTQESLDDLKTAEDRYKQIVERWPGTSVADAAQDRLDWLEKRSTREFYTAFFKHKPQPPQRFPGGRPGFPDAAGGPQFDEPIPSGPEGPRVTMPGLDDPIDLFGPYTPDEDGGDSEVDPERGTEFLPGRGFDGLEGIDGDDGQERPQGEPLDDGGDFPAQPDDAEGDAPAEVIEEDDLEVEDSDDEDSGDVSPPGDG